MEIREIESALKRLNEEKDNTSIYYSTPIIKENNWEKYKFMFTKYLDHDEYNLISEFYSMACRIEQERSVLTKQIAYGFETKCKSLHQSVVDIAKRNPDISDKEFIMKIHEMARKVYMNTPGFKIGAM